ncbi:MAG: DUF418 domain-containing protein [Actinomycetota bacterium]
MTQRSFDHPAAGSTSTGARRVTSLDVTRGLALIGVVAMNYVGSMVIPNGRNGFWDRAFDPYSGALSTRFAATFVLVAGIGLSLLTASARTTDDSSTIARMRWRLARRGVLLYTVGFFLNFAWPGTILFFYGAYFLIAVALFRLSDRALVTIGAGSAIIATAVATWANWKASRGEVATWLVTFSVDSLQDLVVRTFLDYTHPVFPWLAFFCAGMVIGRHLDRWREWRGRVFTAALVITALLYALVSMLDRFDQRRGVIVYALTSAQPYSRSIVYTVTTLGIAVLAFATFDWLVEKFADSPALETLQRAGQLTLSLYLLHVLAYCAIRNWLGWIGGNELSTALLFALGFWIVAITVGSWWHHRIGRGPAEQIYRSFGG